MTTCYDLRFSELYRKLAAGGATLGPGSRRMAVPRLEHWGAFPKVRAVENPCYVAAANGVGTMSEAFLLGRSAVNDPSGTTVAAAGDDEQVLMAEIDTARVAAVREEFPALDDRRDDTF